MAIILTHCDQQAIGLAKQFGKIKSAQNRYVVEILKFGIMVSAQEQFLGEGRGGEAGGGLKGWWEQQAELQPIAYKTAMGYKQMAMDLAERLARDCKRPLGEAVAALGYEKQYQAPDMEKPAKIHENILERRDQILAEFCSKTALQQYLGGGKAGRPKGSGGAVRGPDTRTPQQKARELWAPAILQLGDNSTLAYVRYLDDEAARQALDVIEHARKLIMERLSTINVG